MIVADVAFSRKAAATAALHRLDSEGIEGWASKNGGCRVILRIRV